MSFLTLRDYLLAHSIFQGISWSGSQLIGLFSYLNAKQQHLPVYSDGGPKNARPIDWLTGLCSRRT
jgi:hypothetical protein